MGTKGFFQFKIIINVLVSSSSFIWYMLWVYSHYKYFYLYIADQMIFFTQDYSAGIKFRLQNLMSQIVSRALRVKPGGNFMAVDSLRFTLNINQNYIILFIVIQISYIGLYVYGSSLSDTAVIVDVAYNEPLLMNTLCRQTDWILF